MTVYADYDYYVSRYSGSLVPEAAFLKAAVRASATLDALTYGQIDEAWAQDDAVRMACCAVCDAWYAAVDMETGSERAVVQQERVDYHSVTYASGAAATSVQRKLSDAAHLYLWRTGLMSAAVPYRERCCP